MASSRFRNQPHGLHELPTCLRATQQPNMLGPSLGEGLPASHLGVPTTLRAENGHQRRVLCHGSTPSRLCLGGGAVSDSEGIRHVCRPWWGYHTIEALTPRTPDEAAWRTSTPGSPPTPDDVPQRGELPVVRFGDVDPKCLIETDEEVEVVEGINVQ